MTALPTEILTPLSDDAETVAVLLNEKIEDLTTALAVLETHVTDTHAPTAHMAAAHSLTVTLIAALVAAGNDVPTQVAIFEAMQAAIPSA